MLIPCKCYLRKCKHFIGIEQPDGTEMSERYVCEAFPDAIPEEIAYDDNLHQTPIPGQENEIVFEKAEK